MIIRHCEIDNIWQFVIREIKRDCCKPEVVWFSGRSWYLPIVGLGFTHNPVFGSFERTAIFGLSRFLTTCGYCPSSCISVRRWCRTLSVEVMFGGVWNAISLCSNSEVMSIFRFWRHVWLNRRKYFLLTIATKKCCLDNERSFRFWMTLLHLNRAKLLLLPVCDRHFDNRLRGYAYAGLHLSLRLRLPHNLSQRSILKNRSRSRHVRRKLRLIVNI